MDVTNEFCVFIDHYIRILIGRKSTVEIMWILMVTTDYFVANVSIASACLLKLEMFV